MGRGGDGAGAELCGAYKRRAGSRSGAHVRERAGEDAACSGEGSSPNRAPPRRALGLAPASLAAARTRGQSLWPGSLAWVGPAGVDLRVGLELVGPLAPTPTASALVGPGDLLQGAGALQAWRAGC